MQESEVNERVKRAFPAMNASFANVVPLPIDGISAVAGDVTIVTSDSDSGVSRDTYVGAYAEADGMRFPAFSLRERSALLALMPSLLGLERVDVEGDPRFSRAYHLCGVHLQKTRALFNDSVVAWFAEHPGWRLESAGRGLLLYWPAKPPGTESAASDAAEIFRRLSDAQRNAQTTAPLDPRAAAAAMRGFLGRQVRKDLLTRADLTAFLAQEKPRKLPANFQRYCDRRAPDIVFGVGFIFALGGLGFAFGFGSQGDWKGIAFGGVFFAVGAPLAFFVGRSRFRLKRLLKRGELTSAKVERLEETGWFTSDNGTIWKLGLRYSVQGVPQQAECKVSRFGIERARDAMEAQKPVSILYDPASPQRALYVDDLITVSPEYEP